MIQPYNFSILWTLGYHEYCIFCYIVYTWTFAWAWLFCRPLAMQDFQKGGYMMSNLYIYMVCMYACICMQDLLPQEISRNQTLKSFWGYFGTEPVAIHGSQSNASIFLASCMYALISLRQLKMKYRTFRCVFRKMVWLQAVQLPLHCWRKLTRKATGEHSINRSGVNRARSMAHSFAGPPCTKEAHNCNKTRLQRWLSIATRLVGHL